MGIGTGIGRALAKHLPEIVPTAIGFIFDKWKDRKQRIEMHVADHSTRIEELEAQITKIRKTFKLMFSLAIFACMLALLSLMVLFLK